MSWVELSQLAIPIEIQLFSCAVVRWKDWSLYKWLTIFFVAPAVFINDELTIWRVQTPIFAAIESREGHGNVQSLLVVKDILRCKVELLGCREKAEVLLAYQDLEFHVAVNEEHKQ